MQHAGRAVVFSGSTVGISLLALVVLPVPFLRSLGIAGMLIPLVSVAVAVTLLPVVLATIGPRLDRRHTGRRTGRAAAGRRGPACIVRHRGVAAARVAGRPRRAPGRRRARSSSATRAPTRWPSRAPPASGLDQLDGLRHRYRAARRRSTRWSARATPRPSPTHSPASDGVRGAVAPADWRREGAAVVAVIPTADGNSPAGRATLERIRAATARPAGRRRDRRAGGARAPTSSTRSTATSRSSSR